MNSIEEIIENYKNYSDQKIEYIAKNPTGLRKEIVPFLVEEIKRRKLNIELIELKLLLGDYEDLEVAWGKSGIQAIIIENALPEIEIEINDVLELLCDGKNRR